MMVLEIGWVAVMLTLMHNSTTIIHLNISDQYCNGFACFPKDLWCFVGFRLVFGVEVW